MICVEQTNSSGTGIETRLQYSVWDDFKRPEALSPHHLADTQLQSQLRSKHLIDAAKVCRLTPDHECKGHCTYMFKLSLYGDQTTVTAWQRTLHMHRRSFFSFPAPFSFCSVRIGKCLFKEIPKQVRLCNKWFTLTKRNPQGRGSNIGYNTPMFDDLKRPEALPPHHLADTKSWSKHLLYTAKVGRLTPYQEC